MHKERSTYLEMAKWGELYAQLASPTFWEYKTTASDWRPRPTGTLAQPQGEVKPVVSTTPSNEAQIFSNSLANPPTILKIGVSALKQQDKKIEFISLKNPIKVAQSLDMPVLLAVVCPIKNDDMPKKNKNPRPRLVLV